MANDKTKIFAEAVDVYIANTGTAGTPPDNANMTAVGWVENGQTKLSVSTRNTVELNSGGDHHLNSKYLLAFMGLETDLVKIQALEAFEDSDIDILLVKRNDVTEGYLFTNLTLIVEPDMDFNINAARKLKLEATRAAGKLSDFYTEETALVGFSI